MKKIDIACIIDDDPIFVYGAQALMQLTNFCNSMMVYNNGEEALNNLKVLLSSGEKLPDVILLDLNMPIMDGWEFLEEFTKIKTEKEITIFIVTSSIDPNDVEKAKTYSEVSNYIVKPVTTESLEHILETYKSEE
jgi:CheY-like chemotaxis protein